MPSEENLRNFQAWSKAMLLDGRQIHENSLINMSMTTDLQNVTNHTKRVPIKLLEIGNFFKLNILCFVLKYSCCQNLAFFFGTSS